MQMLRMHDSRSADELIILDINASAENRTVSHRVFRAIRENAKIPVTVGGGIFSVKQAQEYIQLGADKVCLTSVFHYNKPVIKEIADSLGSQAVVVNINYVWSGGNPLTYNYRSRTTENTHVFDAVMDAVALDAGEIMLTSVDKDGSMEGFDLDILGCLKNLNLNRPVIVAGGSGKQDDFLSILKEPFVMGAAAASIFSFTQHTPQTLRSFCRSSGISMRRP
jgi:cyclase